MRLAVAVALLLAQPQLDLKQQWQDTERELRAIKTPSTPPHLNPMDRTGDTESTGGPASGGDDITWPAGAGGAAVVTTAIALAWAWRRKRTVNADGSSTTEEEATMNYTSTTITKYLPKFGNQRVVFPHRDKMRRRTLQRKANLPPVPATTLPVDCTNNMASGLALPMDGNDALGDCMVAAACHVDNIWTYGRGQSGFTESSFGLSALEKQYEQASGGDNGLDEPTLLQQCWKPGLAGVTAATYLDSLDVDVTNVPLTQYLIDQFFHVFMMWSVPDDFLQNFATGSVWANAGIPDPNLGHGTPLTDIGGPATVASDGTNVNGFYRLVTWGSWAWVSQAFVNSVDPACFVVFSVRQFAAATGYDAHGRHITTQAAVWQAIGGNAIPASVIAAFPPAGPVPVPPAPVPPTPAPVPVPVTFIPPYYIFEGQTLEGLATGYPDVPTADAAAQALASHDQTNVDVRDSKGNLVGTVQPVTPTPAPPPGPAPSPGTQITVPTAGVYQLISPATQAALAKTGLTVDQYVAAGEAFQTALGGSGRRAFRS